MSAREPRDLQELSDDDLLAVLAAALHPDAGLHDAVRAVADAAFSWRTVDVELARLLAEPLVGAATAQLRSTQKGRHYTFDSGNTVVDLAVEDRPGSQLLRGWIDPPAQAIVRVVSSEGTELASCTADELGRFRLAIAATGPVRLEVTRDPLLCTEWFQPG